MKWFLFFFFVTTQIFGLDLSSPIMGTARTTGNKSTLRVGDVSYSFAFPNGWGIGESSTLDDGDRYFSLFPVQGGFGVEICISHLESIESVFEGISVIREEFTETKDLANGFEAISSNACYFCVSQGSHLIQATYVLPEEELIDMNFWDQVKSCLIVTDLREARKAAMVSGDSLVKIPGVEWVCNHPENKLHVFVKSSMFDPESQELDKKYLFQMKEFSSTAFFYLKWDQENLNTKGPYEAHLREIGEEIRKIEQQQRFSKDLQYDLKEGYGIWSGFPYSIITLSGDDFLFAFAIKASGSRNIPYNDFIKRVTWADER